MGPAHLQHQNIIIYWVFCFLWFSFMHSWGAAFTTLADDETRVTYTDGMCISLRIFMPAKFACGPNLYANHQCAGCSNFVGGWMLYMRVHVPRDSDACWKRAAAHAHDVYLRSFAYRYYVNACFTVYVAWGTWRLLANVFVWICMYLYVDAFF